ncbi:hypothetical protein JAAARDRAFT_41060 [Jaapia argillacea MUCL 33604]|uniref:coproporphyrinogen oxidase n=1 Tax=Jaapia argillacea MUCL 33604 TaxID=933084 RepID=A0A067P9J5_9AGAM|nr:hypothetical protein JAAARDRAFT_41060 [Jaapia argillacea MUCL 33604]
MAWWFGGRCDLTHSYFFEEDAKHFHSVLKAGCDQHGADLYPAFKTWCDEYFYLPHRQEPRGINGIFFDDLSDEPHKHLPSDTSAPRPETPPKLFAFIKTMGDSFGPSYFPILTKRMSLPYDDHMRR